MQEDRKGSMNPISLIIRDINAIFYSLGFEFAEGPEIETEFYNFDALNIPAWHPARDMWDTFWLKRPQNAKLEKKEEGEESGRQLLRTHTSPVQVRYMETHQPPIRIIAPGKVFRNEATDATHEAQFYQIEGLAIGRDISLANLKWTLETFLGKLFGTKASVRLRPSFFPFVEPGLEADMSCFKCSGKGCSTCKGTGWIEIMGAGMVHPYVLESVKIDPKKYQGFAFGAGVDRLAMLKYGIDDIREFYTGDLRMVNQF